MVHCKISRRCESSEDSALLGSFGAITPVLGCLGSGSNDWRFAAVSQWGLPSEGAPVTGSYEQQAIQILSRSLEVLSSNMPVTANTDTNNTYKQQKWVFPVGMII